MVTSNIIRRGKQPVSQCHTRRDGWMVNEQGMDPCMLVERLCAAGPLETTGAVSGNLTCPPSNDPQRCCCSVATYALLSACWVCQGNDPTNIDVGIHPSYIDFFQESGCPDDSVLNSAVSQSHMQDVNIPQWAWIPPHGFSGHWSFIKAKTNATSVGQQLGDLKPTILVVSPSTFSGGLTTLSVSGSNSHAPSVMPASPGTIAASVLSSLAIAGVVCFGAWFIRRWRRRHVIHLNRDARVDLTEPEMGEPSLAINTTSVSPNPPDRQSAFPFPFEGIVPRYHPIAPQSVEPSRTDEPTVSDGGRDRDTRITPQEHTVPAMDQLDRDLACLQGITVDVPSNPRVSDPPLGEGQGQVHRPYIHKTHRRRAASITTFTQSSNTGSTSSRRARRKSGGEHVSKGRYFHLPPSAQYLANVARYPEKVDPERPWDIRRDWGTS